MPGEHSRPWMLKAYPRFFDPQGVVVIIDSDMIVTHSLRYVVDKVMAGKICVFPDHFSQWNRSFKEWETDLQLRGPLRRQMYVNAGFIALSTKRWPDFLPRFEDVLERVPGESLHSIADLTDPFWGAGQDALNALAKQRLMELFRRRPRGPSRVDESP
jgi:lipopolysaccharide biosynthesis glycosyltransferase